MNSLIKKLVDNNWTFDDNFKSSKLPISIAKRYPIIPEDYINFISSFSELTSPDDKSWFLSIDDYNDRSESEFKWNEFELLSLQSAGNDSEWENEIKEFWNKHLPIFISVEDGYEYSAISLNEDSFGCIVKGYEPEFKEVEVIAESFDAFIDILVRANW